MLSRRQFASRLAAASLSLPFLNPRAFAADTPAKRLVLIYSIGTDNTLWRPTSAPGAALALPTCTAPLSKIADHIVMADGLSFLDPSQNHSTWMTFTGVTSSTSFPGSRRSQNVMSVDQYILAKQPPPARVPCISLGVGTAVDEGQFFNQSRLPPEQDIAGAFNHYFGGAKASAPPAGGTSDAFSLPRQAILSQVQSELKALQSSLGAGAKQRLEQHISALVQLEKTAMPLVTGGACSPMLPAGIGGRVDSAFALQNGAAAYSLIAQAFACDITRIATMQWSRSNSAPLNPAAGSIIEEHGDAVHGPNDEKLGKCEAALCSTFADFVALLQATPDPTGQGSLLDNTLIMWTRDMGQARAHISYAVPTVFAGATGYLATKAGGNYIRLEGDDATGKKSAITHDAMLLNCLEWMGVQDISGFGMQGGASAPLANIKKA